MYYVVALYYFPGVIAYLRDAKIVSHSVNMYDDISRAPCANGGAVVYFSHYNKAGQPFLGVIKNNKTNYVKINKEMNVDWCGNKVGDRPIILLWSENISEKKGSVQYRLSKKSVLDRNNGMSRFVLSDIGTDSLRIGDYNNKWLLAHIVGSDGSAGVFLFSFENGSYLIPEIREGRKNHSGVLFKDGFLFSTNTDKNVYYFNLKTKEKTFFGKKRGVYYTSYTMYGNNVAWYERNNGLWRINGYDLERGSWSLSGKLPFLYRDTIFRVIDNKNDQSIIVSKINGDNRKELVRGGDIKKVVYHDGILYWEEEVVNILFPFQFLYNILFYSGSNKYALKNYRYLFSKEMRKRERP